MPTTYKQDMPPSGGYQSFNWLKRPSVKPISGLYILAVLYGSLIAGSYFFKRFKRKQRKHFGENNELRIALTPFLIAESQREYLKHIHNTRESEKELMGDVPGWEVGKWFEYPVYHNPRNLMIISSISDYFGQMTGDQQKDHQLYHHWIY